MTSTNEVTIKYLTKNDNSGVVKMRLDNGNTIELDHSTHCMTDMGLVKKFLGVRRDNILPTDPDVVASISSEHHLDGKSNNICVFITNDKAVWMPTDDLNVLREDIKSSHLKDPILNWGYITGRGPDYMMWTEVFQQKNKGQVMGEYDLTPYIPIMGGGEGVVMTLMHTPFCCNALFICMEAYNQALKNGFDPNYFKEKNGVNVVVLA